MKRVLAVLLFVLALLGAGLSTVVQADEPNPPAACDYSYPPLKAQRTETLISAQGSDGTRVVLVNYVQVAESTNCLDRVRGASTLRCYLDFDRPANCSTYGYTILQNTTSGSWADIPASQVNFNVTALSTGTTSFYTGYRDRHLCVNYRVRVVIAEVLIGGRWVDTEIISTASNAYIYCEA